MLDETILEKIKEAALIIKHAGNLVAFTGAGISTDSGIPDFRSEESGLWNSVDQMMVASIGGFRRNPQAFYEWVRPLSTIMLNAKPNAAHDALVDLEKMGLLKTVVTQNIDMLHTRAGNSKIFELHGHLREATCIHCFQVYDGEAVMRNYLDTNQLPHCPSCGSVLKPNVILFGEQLPIRELQGAQEAAKKCDVMLIVGSSLEVAPASDIPVIAKRNGSHLIIVNLEPTPADRLADVVIQGRAAHILPEIVRYVEMAT